MASTVTVTQAAKIVPTANASATGDTVLVGDGIHDHTSEETITKGGVIVRPANKGKCTIKGAPIHVTGSLAEFRDFILQYGSTNQTVCNLRGAGVKFLNNVCQFLNKTTKRNDWFYIGANNVLFEGNDIPGKSGLGNIVLVGAGSVYTGVKILNNRIYKHSAGSTPDVTNGYEMIRIGNSTVAAKNFGCEVAGNTLEDSSMPDSELITVKSSGNDIHDNTIKNCSATICLRHGRLNKVRNNNFQNGGLRIYGRGHEVTGNKFTRNPLSDLRQIVIGNAQYPEEESNTTAGYTQVRDLLFEKNTIDMQDSTDKIIVSWGYGSYSLKPLNNKFINNSIVASRGTLANTRDGASWNGNTVSGNLLWATGSARYGDMPTAGYTKKDPSTVTPPTPIPPEPIPIPPEPTPSPIPLTLEQRVARLEKQVFGSVYQPP